MPPAALPVRKPAVDLARGFPRHWHGGDAFRTQFFNALSMRFPVGGQFFIDSVRAAAERLDATRPDHAALRTLHRAAVFDLYRAPGGSNAWRVRWYLYVGIVFMVDTMRQTVLHLRRDDTLWRPGTWISAVRMFWGRDGVAWRSIPALLRYVRRAVPLTVSMLRLLRPSWRNRGWPRMRTGCERWAPPHRPPERFSARWQTRRAATRRRRCLGRPACRGPRIGRPGPAAMLVRSSHQSSFVPAASITFPHFSVSAFNCVAYACTPRGRTSIPIDASC